MDYYRTQIAFAMALLQVSQVGSTTVSMYRDSIFSLQSADDCYSLLRQIANRFPKIKAHMPSETVFSKYIDSAMACLAEQERNGVHCVSYKSPDYPVGFHDLKKPPVFFFYKGNRDALHRKSIAVVGSRQIESANNILARVGGKASEYIAKQGWVVVSGLAIGSDTVGHRGCLNADGVTIATMATPLNQVYPRQNKGLCADILANNGCIISEYPIKSVSKSPTDCNYSFHSYSGMDNLLKYHLVERDRLQSGLARGVFVIATGEIGGTWHAINEARKLGKPIGILDPFEQFPNCISSSLQDGMHKVVRVASAMAIHNSKDLQKFLNLCESHGDYESVSLF